MRATPPVSRSEHAHQLRVSLLEALTANSGPVCAICGEPCELEDLQIDHRDGITWRFHSLNRIDRTRRMWREYLQGVALRAACLACNVRIGQRFKGKNRRYA
jgi:hypothetical protein